MNLENRARKLAIYAHAEINQRRKYDGLPYIVHPARVVRILKKAGITNQAMLAAAWLHDVLEDTPTPRSHIVEQCGEEVAILVDWLTDVSKPQDGNRAFRKEKDRLHSACAPPEAQTIKLADLIDNHLDISKADPSFYTVYRREGVRLLEVLIKGDAELRNRLADLFEETPLRNSEAP